MKRIILIIILLAFSSVSLFVWKYLSHRNGFSITFCDVGQGDAALIQTPNGTTILVDGGPDDKVLSCLSNHLSPFEKTIDAVFLSHPHTDHYVGLLSVLQVYGITHYYTENITSDTNAFKRLQSQLLEKSIPTSSLLQGNNLHTTDGVTITVVGPTQQFLQDTSPNGTIGESSEFGSLELLVSYKGKTILLSGDSQASELTSALPFLSHIDVIHIPHHGSKTGLNDEILTQLTPSLAAISVGVKNKYGHPSADTLQLLKNHNIPYLRTDQKGDITITVDEQGILHTN